MERSSEVKVKKKYGNTELIPEKTEDLHAELNEKVEAAASS